MPVFKASMKIARRNLGLIALYVGVIVLSLLMTIGNQTNPQDTAYAASSMNISLVDQDNSPLSHALRDYLGEIHTLKECENDSAALLEDLYYRNSDYVLRIPQGFGEDPAGHPLQVTEVPGSYTGVYLEYQIGSRLRQLELYQTAGFSLEEAVSMAAEAPSPEISVLNGQEEEEISIAPFFQFLPYGAICMLSFVVGNVMSAFMKTEIRKRTNSSAFTHRRTELELIASVAVFGIAVFVIFLIMGTAFYGRDFWQAQGLMLYFSNMAMMILVCTAIAYLIAMVVRSQESLSGVVNALSLGMSFLCGVFVPLELLGDGVKAAAHFLPFYWYEEANLLIARLPSLDAAQLMQLRSFLGIQGAFALAFLALGAAAHRKRCN